MFFEGIMQVSGALKKQPAHFTVRFANLDREVEALQGKPAAMRPAYRRRIVVPAADGVPVAAAGAHCFRPVDLLQANDENNDPPGQSAEWVRACLVRPLGDCVVEVAPRAVAPVVRTDVEGNDSGYDCLRPGCPDT